MFKIFKKVGKFVKRGLKKVGSFFKRAFKKDLFYEEFQNFLVISSNFSNNNWLPSESQKRKINYFQTFDATLNFCIRLFKKIQ